MEIINNNDMQDQKPVRKKQDTTKSRNAYLGITLVAAGVLWMLYNFEMIGASLFDKVFSWQMLLIVTGGYLMSVRKWAAGGIVAATGVIFALAKWFDIHLPLNDVLLPIIIIGLGVAILLQNRP